MSVLASIVTHDPAGVSIWIGYPSVLHCVLCFVRPTAAWTGGNKYKSFNERDSPLNSTSAEKNECNMSRKEPHKTFAQKCWICWAWSPNISPNITMGFFKIMVSYRTCYCKWLLVSTKVTVSGVSPTCSFCWPSHNSSLNFIRPQEELTVILSYYIHLTYSNKCVLCNKEPQMC